MKRKFIQGQKQAKNKFKKVQKHILGLEGKSSGYRKYLEKEGTQMKIWVNYVDKMKDMKRISDSGFRMEIRRNMNKLKIR